MWFAPCKTNAFYYNNNNNSNNNNNNSNNNDNNNDNNNNYDDDKNNNNNNNNNSLITHSRLKLNYNVFTNEGKRLYSWGWVTNFAISFFTILVISY